MELLFGLFLLPGLIVGLTVHEAAHALSAKWLGDRNPERMGRVSLNPFRHLSAMGTLAIFLLGFGWGKPVEVNLYNFRRPKLYYLLSSLAGPVSNLLLCGVSLGMMYGLASLVRLDAFRAWGRIPFMVLYGAAMSCYLVNGMLAAINLLPVPPLDGSKIWPCIIPRMRPTLSGKWSAISAGILVVALMTGMVGKIVGPSMVWMKGLMPHEVFKSKIPAFITAPAEAADRHRYRQPRGSEDPNAYGYNYTIAEVYPAEKMLAFYDSLLPPYGWEKLTHNLNSPDELAKGWENYSNDSDPNHPDIYWLNQQFWINDTDEILELTLKVQEESPVKEQPVNIRVWLEWYCNDTKMRQLAQQYRRMHPKEAITDPNVLTMIEEPHTP